MLFNSALNTRDQKSKQSLYPFVVDAFVGCVYSRRKKQGPAGQN
jgi:hypothetical protein